MTLRTSKSNTFDYDADAATYILAVEAADGQRLEYGVRQAINSFVLGCKEDGIWDAIKASCIMAGARTLAGALVPLKGAAPTNFNFVNADYSRRTGLKGDGSTKYLNSNRNNNVDIATNHHIAVRAERRRNTVNEVLIGARATGVDTGGKFTTYSASGNLTQYASTPNADVNQTGGSLAPNAISFQGLSRSSNGAYTARVSSTDTTFSQASTAAISANIFVFALNNGGTASLFTDARISFYSIGESLNLEALDNRIRVLMYTLSHNVTYDTDAQAYITAVETADGQPLEVGVKAAIDEFVVGCKKDGIWDAIKASCIMAGAKTLAGALVPLKGTAPTNFNFVAADYNRKTGLKGDGSTKYLNSNLLDSSIPQNSAHVSAYQTGSATTAAFLLGVRNDGATSVTQINTNSASPVEITGQIRDNFSTSPVLGLSSAITFAGYNRATSTTFQGRALGTATSFSATSTTPVSRTYHVFSSNNGSGSAFIPTTARLAFYSIGESLDLALLDARITTLINNFAAILP